MQFHETMNFQNPNEESYQRLHKKGHDCSNEVEYAKLSIDDEKIQFLKPCETNLISISISSKKELKKLKVLEK